jgi:hydrogenase maturation protein HypF
MKTGARVVLGGVVQGVGFRPFLHRLASSKHLKGWVLNSSRGVVVEVEGEKGEIDSFYREIEELSPPLANVENKKIEFHPPSGLESFIIRESEEEEEYSVLVSPDISICPDCLRELSDPEDRRFRYPFINCTNCGPRFTIIKELPYDRPKTTMKKFTMCPQCRKEYSDIHKRRYHAQPNACLECGPEVELIQNPGTRGQVREKGEKAVKKSIKLLKEGKIVAIKGLGGFHLACDARNEKAVRKLRKRKKREAKPFAIMSLNAEEVEKYCYLNEKERELLESPSRPIVLVKKKEDCPISNSVAPHNNYLGVMLPYTPLHYLLFNRQLSALVMTSGNLSDEPLVTDNREAKTKLAKITPYFLAHNRDIHFGCDDSIIKMMGGGETLLRRARGYAPLPLHLKSELPPILACGGELKNTFCLTKGKLAFLSQHIGDLKNLETFQYYKRAIGHFENLFHLEPEIIAYDLHPDYLSTKYARELSGLDRELPTIGIQHHHAHLVSCLAENGIEEKVIGVILDGTGYGDDGKVWGGEFLIGDYRGYQRLGHLQYLPLPGGDKAAEEPWRMALSYLHYTFGKNFLKLGLDLTKRIEKEKVSLLIEMIEKGVNSPLTSSWGRFFDAVSSLIGICDFSSYEGQAAIEMEMKAGPEAGSYKYEIEERAGVLIVDPKLLIREIVEDLKKKVSPAVISSRFHNSTAEIILDICLRIRKKKGLSKAALSGGVFQNKVLTEKVLKRLKENSFECYTHSKVPPNDGGISLGQAVIAAEKFKPAGRRQGGEIKCA